MVEAEHEALGRLKDMLIAAGKSPTPEGLAHLKGWSLERAGEVFAFVAQLPAALVDLAEVCRGTKFRLSWLVTGAGLPNADHSLETEEAEALDLLSDMTPTERRNWLRSGRHMRKR